MGRDRPDARRSGCLVSQAQSSCAGSCNPPRVPIPAILSRRYLSPIAIHQSILRLHIRASARRAFASHAPAGIAQRKHPDTGTWRPSSGGRGNFHHRNSDGQRQQAGRENLPARGARSGAVPRRGRVARADARLISRNHQFYPVRDASGHRAARVCWRQRSAITFWRSW